MEDLDWPGPTQRAEACSVGTLGCIDPGFVSEIHGMAVWSSGYSYDEHWCPHLILSSARLVSVHVSLGNLCLIL